MWFGNVKRQTSPGIYWAAMHLFSLWFYSVNPGKCRHTTRKIGYVHFILMLLFLLLNIVIYCTETVINVKDGDVLIKYKFKKLK